MKRKNTWIMALILLVSLISPIENASALFSTEWDCIEIVRERFDELYPNVKDEDKQYFYLDFVDRYSTEEQAYYYPNANPNQHICELQFSHALIRNLHLNITISADGTIYNYYPKSLSSILSKLTSSPISYAAAKEIAGGMYSQHVKSLEGSVEYQAHCNKYGEESLLISNCRISVNFLCEELGGFDRDRWVVYITPSLFGNEKGFSFEGCWYEVHIYADSGEIRDVYGGDLVRLHHTLLFP